MLKVTLILVLGIVDATLQETALEKTAPDKSPSNVANSDYWEELDVRIQHTHMTCLSSAAQRLTQ